MDVEEVRRILFSRVQSNDAVNAFKIMGYLLLQDWAEQELFMLALGSDDVLTALVNKAKKELGLHAGGDKLGSTGGGGGGWARPASSGQLSYGLVVGQLSFEDDTDAVGSVDFSSPMMMPPATSTDNAMLSFYNDTNSNTLGSSYSTTMPRFNVPLSTRSIIRYPHTSQQWCSSSPTSAAPAPATSSALSALPPPPPASTLFHEKSPTFNYNFPSEDHLLLHHHSFFRPHHSSTNSTSGAQSMSSINRSCLFFSRGYCKHGNTCRFLHHGDGLERYNPNGASSNGEVEVESSGSDDGYSYAHHLGFESFEMELRELLKGRKTPVSIASLPQMYYERFGKSLQAEGYLTESQRHGKAGFSLTRLLMRLKGTVRLIERPHGQHAVMLLEEGLHLLNEVGRCGGPEELVDSMNASSRQIYLTFPAESSFTEEDVTIHFRAYGPVQDVRIPHQQKRMFGFVTFIYPDTVRTILTEGNPHYICGARVLVKPYKEKGRKSSASPGLIHRERQDANLTLQEERLNIEAPVVMEPKLGQAEIHGNEQKEASLNPTGTKLDASEFDIADISLLSSNFKYVLDLLEGENKDAEISDSNSLSVSRTNSKALNLKLGSTDNNTDTVTATSLQKVRSNLWSSQVRIKWENQNRVIFPLCWLCFWRK